jgi:uncharacterized membrane protein YdjX (TVP38/TMEM64 family)
MPKSPSEEPHLAAPHLPRSQDGVTIAVAHPKRLEFWRNRRFWLAIALVCLLACLFTSPFRNWLHQEALVMHLKDWGMLAPVLFVTLHVVATVLGVPGTVLTLAGGIVFGIIWGTVWSAIGASVGAVGAFLVARYLLHDWAARKFGHHPMLLRLNQSISKHPFQFIFTIRLMPISPFNLVNFLFGLTRAPLGEYASATFLGIIPGTALYTWIGESGRNLLAEGERLPFLLAIASLLLLSVLPLLARRDR